MYDLIVIGGGPAGYHAAGEAGHRGLKTLLIEKREVGGVCLNEGCIPTKTLLYSAKIKDNAAGGEKYGVKVSDISLDHKRVLARKKKTVAALVGGVKAVLKSAGVETITADASITGRDDDGFQVKCGDSVYSGKRLLIATGSVPVLPPVSGMDEALKSGFAVTNREILELEQIPEKLTVIGGGVIGLEMASYFASAGSDVTVIEMLEQVGGPIDADISGLLKKNLEKKGIKFFLESKVIEVKQKSVVYEHKSGKNEAAADLVLLSVGRRAYTQGIGLESIGVETHRGAVKTDGRMQTNIPGVYAAGDVNGMSMLAHTAYREAEVAVNNMTGKEDTMSYRAIPGVIYTHPEVAGTGETERSAKEKGLDFRAKTLTMRYSGRYVAENEGGDGIAKILIDNRYGRIIGLHMIGSYASEMIYGACMMIEQDMTIEAIKKTVFPHPTVCEIIKELVFQI
ncbi:MAG: dihydrolipoyl dehydrogenase [Eubacteriales bacterium]|nr:dihydrolipoyl dehydrogenase [Eubacteriales bacterium]